jgi:hypothetical protein
MFNKIEDNLLTEAVPTEAVPTAGRPAATERGGAELAPATRRLRTGLKAGPRGSMGPR